VKNPRSAAPCRWTIPLGHDPHDDRGRESLRKHGSRKKGASLPLSDSGSAAPRRNYGTPFGRSSTLPEYLLVVIERRNRRQ
jgi:hypothetical protein